MGRPRKYPRKDDVQSSSTTQNSTQTNTQISTIDVNNKPNNEINSKTTEDNLMIPNVIVKVKKKRGRKPKIRTPEELERMAQIGKKKRGRKPKEKFNFNVDNNPVNFEEENDSIVVRLPINFENLEKQFNNPSPFDPNGTNFLNINKNDNKNDNTNIQSITNNNNNNNNNNDNSNNNTSNISSNIINNNNNNIIISNENENENNINKTLKTSLIKDNNQTTQSLLENNDKNTENTISSNSDNTSFIENIRNSNNTNNTNHYKELNNKRLFNNMFQVENIKDTKLDNRQISQLLKNKYTDDNKIELFNQLIHCNKIKKWPEKTKTACLWCCHEFDNVPWGIPHKYENNLFHLFGIFCSPNCCASYIFDNNQNSDTKWEQYALLNFLYYKLYGEFKKITFAPSKLCLKKFGGCLDINEYRAKFMTNNEFILKFPPCISIIPIIEEVNKNEIQIGNKQNKFIPIDKNRIKKANIEYKLKRSKPINNIKNTLDSCMNINIVN